VLLHTLGNAETRWMSIEFTRVNKQNLSTTKANPLLSHSNFPKNLWPTYCCWELRAENG
jgi:hypothetical protein